jgi:hypothetical protein
VGTLDGLGAAPIPATSAGAAGMLVIGAVVGLAAELAVDLSTLPVQQQEKGQS